jgi:uncharacterized protein YbaP (TraB family)
MKPIMLLLQQFTNSTVAAIRLLILMTILNIFGITTYKAMAQEIRPGIFFQVTGNELTDTSYLFGTYHLVNSDYLHKLKPVEQAFEKARGVVVEIIMDTAEMQKAQVHALSKDTSLTALLDQSFIDSLENELKENVGIGLQYFNQLKPMNVTLTLSLIYLMKNNAELLKQYTGQPLDQYISSKGRENNKTVIPLETISEQMNLLFNSSSIEKQAEGLKAFIRNKKAMLAMGDELLQHWFKHDLAGMYPVYEKTIALSGEEDYLLKNRNLQWMKKIPSLLKKESQFIAIGALHLAGEFGLVTQLRNAGYTVTPVKL